MLLSIVAGWCCMCVLRVSLWVVGGGVNAVGVGVVCLLLSLMLLLALLVVAVVVVRWCVLRDV